MDLITQTSLEALLLKATNPHNQNIDTAAVEAFCTLINKEKDGAHIGVKVIANRLPSGNEKEMLQTLNILDTCMNRCGANFQSEIGKFRFLNEMIKLVSPKYLGSHTPLSVKQKVLQIMYLWTLDYPKETKIKEAYDMLRKQGVIRDIPNPNINTENLNVAKRKQACSVFQDEEKSKILQKLLQSKDPEDIQAANWLIKSMVKEDDKRAEMKSKRTIELESVQNNVRLLNEMLDSYKPGISSKDELDLIKELHQSCERLRPNVLKLASETQQNEEILGDILQATDELSQVFDKFVRIIIKGNINPRNGENLKETNLSLLDFGNSVDTLKDGASKYQSSNATNTKDDSKSDIDVLCDIFTVSNNIPDCADVLVPISVLQCDKKCEKSESSNKMRALEDLDVLSEHLLKENLQSTGQTTFNKINDKIPLNQLSKQLEIKQNNQNPSTVTKNDNLVNNLDLNYLINKPKNEAMSCGRLDSSSDDLLVDLNASDEKMIVDNIEERVLNETVAATINKNKSEIKLSDIFIKLENIKPSTVPPLKILDERNGITITLHLAKDKPREDVFVFVATTISKNELPLNNFLFQAVIPKGCKIKLQPPSATELPAFNPFLPPSAITQIMLIAKPDNVQISLKFIVSYVIDDETITEMGEVEHLPLI